MQLLTLNEAKVKQALADPFECIEVAREDGGIGVTSYASNNGLIWTRCMDGLPGGWDVYDADLGASAVVVLEPWEERLIVGKNV